jgi:hypothetical protein
MSRSWPELVVALLLVAALVLAPLRQRRARADARAEAQALVARGVEAQALWPGPYAAQDAPELLAFPPPDSAAGRALVAALGPERLLDARQLAPLVVAWYAGVDPAALDEPTLLLLAASTARVLGSEEGATHSASGFARASLAGLEPLRAALEARCGACAPAPGPLPAAQLPGGLPPSIQGERMARSADPEAVPREPLGALVGSLRQGGQAPPAAWEQPGHAGMAALELGRAGRTEALDRLLEAAVSGPSALDRLAALHAALWLVQPESWPAGPARERGLALRYELEAGSR